MFMNREGKYGKYIVQNLQDPNLGSADFQAMYKKFAKRILWIDKNVVEGAFQMNTAWYFNVPEKDPVFEEHAHDYDEYFTVVEGQYTVIIDNKETTIRTGQECYIPKGTPHAGRSVAGTRTIHCFGGKRI